MYHTPLDATDSRDPSPQILNNFHRFIHFHPTNFCPPPYQFTISIPQPKLPQPWMGQPFLSKTQPVLFNQLLFLKSLSLQPTHKFLQIKAPRKPFHQGESKVYSILTPMNQSSTSDDPAEHRRCLTSQLKNINKRLIDKKYHFWESRLPFQSPLYDRQFPRSFLSLEPPVHNRNTCRNRRFKEQWRFHPRRVSPLSSLPIRYQHLPLDHTYALPRDYINLPNTSFTVKLLGNNQIGVKITRQQSSQNCNERLPNTPSTHIL